LINKKKEKKMIFEKKEKKKKREKEQASPTWPPQTPKCCLTPSRILLFYIFVVYHKGPWSIHTRYVCGLSLGANLKWTFYNQAAAAAAPKLPSTNTTGKNTLVCKDK
jgi:hypothetical protein